MNPIYQDLKLLPPLRLHYAIGVNCYQNMRGYNYPLIAISEAPEKYKDKFQLLDYISLYPGNASKTFLTTAPQTRVDVERVIIEGCKEDGIIVLGNVLETISNMTPAAVFFSKENTIAGLPSDFHFAVRCPDGQWEDKVPFRDKKKYAELPMQIDGYQFSHYLLVPKDEPIEIKRLQPEFRLLTGITGSEKVGIVDKRKVNFGSNILVDLDNNIAFEMQRKIHIPSPFINEVLKTPYVRKLE